MDKNAIIHIIKALFFTLPTWNDLRWYYLDYKITNNSIYCNHFYHYDGVRRYEWYSFRAFVEKNNLFSASLDESITLWKLQE
jgi:hypothetical protein